jgi:hypothetical protein
MWFLARKNLLKKDSGRGPSYHSHGVSGNKPPKRNGDDPVFINNPFLQMGDGKKIGPSPFFHQLRAVA